MANLVPILRPGDVDPWQSLDWTVDADGRQLNTGKIVDQEPDLYRVAGGKLTINETGRPVARMRFCRDDDCIVNFRRNKGLLAASDVSASIEPSIAPITLRFATPLRAVGAYVGVVLEPALQGQRLQAVMWVKQAGPATVWHPVNAIGMIDGVLADDTAESAAFVGARIDGGGPGIVQVCFDASVVGRFRFLAISDLFWAA